MFNRVNISTTLFIILVFCGLLQTGSNGLFFFAFHGDKNLHSVKSGNQQRELLTPDRVAWLQAARMLSHAGTLTALGYLPDDRKREDRLMRVTQQSFTQFESRLQKQIFWLENSQWSAFLNTPSGEAEKNVASYVNRGQQTLNQHMADAQDNRERSHRLSALIFGSVTLMVIVLTFGYGASSRQTTGQSLTSKRRHVDMTAAEERAKRIAVFCRNKISLMFASLKKGKAVRKKPSVSTVRAAALCTAVFRI